MTRPTPPWPLSLTVNAARDRVRIAYEDGTEHTLSAEFLRVETPSAERKGHGRRMVIAGKRAVTVKAMEPVGRYAVRIAFSDGHDTGLYPFDALYQMGAEQADRWSSYEAELAATGLSRDRAGTAPAPT